MEPMEIELLLVLKNLAQDVRHFLLRQKNETDKCIADFDKTHDKQKLCHKLTDILCELNASSLQHARAIEKRIKDFGEENEFDSTIKKLEQLLLVSKSQHETNNEENLVPIAKNASEEVQLSQCSSVHIGENLVEKLSQPSTVEYSIESDSQEILDNLLDKIDSQEEAILNPEPVIVVANPSTNSDQLEGSNSDPNMSLAESDFDVADLISYDHLPQVSSGSSAEDVNSTVVEVSSNNQNKAPSVDGQEKPSEVDSDDSVQASDANVATVDQEKTKLPSVSNDQAKSDPLEAPLSPVISNYSNKVRLPSGADESDSDVDVAKDAATKVPSDANSDADFDASTEVPSDNSDQDKLPLADSDAAEKIVTNGERESIEEELRQEAVNNDGDISASDSATEARGQVDKKRKISKKAKEEIQKVIREFVRKKIEERNNGNNSDGKESSDKSSTKKKRKRRKKINKDDKINPTNSSSSDIDTTNKTSPDDKKDNTEPYLEDSDPSETISKKKTIKPLPPTSSDSESILNQKKSAAVPLPSSEDSDAVRGTKRLLSSSDDNGSEPPKKISADDNDCDDLIEPSKKISDDDSDDSTQDIDNEEEDGNSSTTSNRKRKISESSSSSASSYEFNLNSAEIGIIPEAEEEASQAGLSSQGRNDLLTLLNDKEREEARINQDNSLNLFDQEQERNNVEESSSNSDSNDDGSEKSSADDVATCQGSKMFCLDEAGRDELLNLLNEKFPGGYEIEEEGEGEEGGGDNNRQRTNENGVNNDIFLEIVNEYMQTISTGQDSDNELTVMNFDAVEGVSKPDLDSGSDSNSELLDLVRTEIVESDNKKPTTEDEETDDELVWDAFRKLTNSDDDYLSSSSSSSAITDIDLKKSKTNFSNRQEEIRKINNKLKRDFGIDKELHIDLEEIDVSGYDNVKVARKNAKKIDTDDSCTDDSEEIDRLCNLSTIGRKRNKSKPIKRDKKYARYHTGSESSCSSIQLKLRLRSASINSLYVGYDSDNDLQSLENDVPEDRSLSDQSDERFHTDLIDKITNSSDEDLNKNDSDDDDEYESSDDEKPKRKILTKKVKKVKEGSSGSEREEDGEVQNLDSSDEEDFVGVQKSRGLWRNDPLLASDSDSDDENLKKNRKKRGKTDSESAQEKTPNEDSDDNNLERLEKTPSKPIIVITDDESSSKKNTGRRNIKPLMENDALAISTQIANNEEQARIKRLQERDKDKELYSLINNTCNIEEEDPLILDAYKNIEIRIHPKITANLKAHQREGIQFMWDSCYESIKQLEKGWAGSGCILAHCMGLGKTLQALALIQTLFNCDVTKTRHVLVVCPLSTVSNWKNEFRLAYGQIRKPNVRLFTIENEGNRRFRIIQDWYKCGGLLVLGYECFAIMIDDRKWQKWNRQGLGRYRDDIFEALVDPGPDLIICDEGHLLRNKQTQRTMALNRVKTRRRIVLTGTPLQNNLLEYYYMVHFVKPNLLGTEKEFKTNFVNPISNGQFEDSTAEDIMFMKKRTHVLHKILNKTVQRVEDSELKQYLPSFTDQAVFLKLSDLQVKLYNAYLDMVDSRPAVFTKAGDISRANFLGDIQILRYICQHPDVVAIAERTSRLKIKEQDVIDDMDYMGEVRAFARDGWYKDLLPKEGTKKLEMGSKMMTVVNLVKEAAEVGDKVLIFAQAYAEMENLEWFLCNYLQLKKGRDYYRMDGTIKAERRADMCKSFNSNQNSLKVFIMSTKVGGLGLNLTAANRVILMNVNWNPSYDIQSVFRVFRFGQTKPVYVYRLIAMGTMEEKMYQRQVTKLAVAHRVVDKHQITNHYSAADIQEFYSVRPTIAGDRPVPNVPEDRVLAKLLQKHKFIHRWHEHQALLANRPEEDLNELQKNAAWEEFNRKPDPPPQLYPPPPTITIEDHPNFRTASAYLANQSPLVLRPGFHPHQHHRPLNLPPGREYGPPRLPHQSGPMAGPRPAHTGTWAVQRPPRPVLVMPNGPLRPLLQAGSSGLGQVSCQKVNNAGRQRSPHPLMLSRKNQKTMNTIDNVNKLVRSQTMPRQNIPTTSASVLTRTASRSEMDPKLHEQITEFNSVLSEYLNKMDYNPRKESQDWADDGMEDPLSTINIPSSSDEDVDLINPDHSYSLPKVIPAAHFQKKDSIDDFHHPKPNILSPGNKKQQISKTAVINPASQHSSFAVQKPSQQSNNAEKTSQSPRQNVKNVTKTTVINIGQVEPKINTISNQNVSVGNGVTLSVEKPTLTSNLLKKRPREQNPSNSNSVAVNPAKKPKLDNQHSTINLSHLSSKNAGDSLRRRIEDAIIDVKNSVAKGGVTPQRQARNSLVATKSPLKNKESTNERIRTPPSRQKSDLSIGGGASGVRVTSTNKKVVDLTSPPSKMLTNQHQLSPRMRESVRDSLDHLRKLQQLGNSSSGLTDLKNDAKSPQIESKILNFQQNPKNSPTMTRIMGPRQTSPGKSPPANLNAAKNLNFSNNLYTTTAIATSPSANQTPKSPNVVTTPPRTVAAHHSKMKINGVSVTVTPSGTKTSPKVTTNQSPGRQKQQLIQQAPMPVRFVQGGRSKANTLQKTTNDLNKIIQISAASGSAPISPQQLPNKKPVIGGIASAASLSSSNQLPSTPTGLKSNKENRTKKKLSLKNAEENRSSRSSSQERLFSDLKRKGCNISPVKNCSPIRKNDTMKKD